jgi:hypothetical protein
VRSTAAFIVTVTITVILLVALPSF